MRRLILFSSLFLLGCDRSSERKILNDWQERRQAARQEYQRHLWEDYEIIPDTTPIKEGDRVIYSVGGVVRGTDEYLYVERIRGDEMTLVWGRADPNQRMTVPRSAVKKPEQRVLKPGKTKQERPV